MAFKIDVRVGVLLWFFYTHVTTVHIVLQIMFFRSGRDFEICPCRSFQGFDILFRAGRIPRFQELVLHHSHVDKYLGAFPICFSVTVIPL